MTVGGAIGLYCLFRGIQIVIDVYQNPHKYQEEQFK